MTARARSIVLDPGHGGARDEGSASPEGARGPRGTLEKDLTLDLSLRIRDALARSGHGVVLTRQGDESVSLRRRALASRREGAAAFVSIHFNDSPDPSAEGHEVWVHGEGASGRSAELGERIRDALSGATGSADRGTKRGAMAVLDPRYHGDDTPACLVEVGFLSNPEVESRLRDGGYRGRLAGAVAAGIERFLSPGRGVVEQQRHFDVWHEVPLVPQWTGMSCWAAAAAMIIGWRYCIDVDPEDIVHGTGQWEAYRDGLDPSDVQTLCRAWELEQEPVRTLTVEWLRGLLETSGPAWIGEASPGLHVIVIAGMYGDGTGEGTFVRVIDPWPEHRGERYVVSFRELLAGFEAVESVAGVKACILHAGGRAAGASRGSRVHERVRTRMSWKSG